MYSQQTFEDNKRKRSLKPELKKNKNRSRKITLKFPLFPHVSPLSWPKNGQKTANPSSTSEDRLPTFSKQVVAWSTKQKGYLIYAAANQITKVEKHQKKAWVLPLLIPCVFAPFRGSCSSFLFFFLLPCPLSLSPFLLRCIPCSAPLPSASSFATSMPLAIPFPLFSNPL